MKLAEVPHSHALILCIANKTRTALPFRTRSNGINRQHKEQPNWPTLL